MLLMIAIFLNCVNHLSLGTSFNDYEGKNNILIFSFSIQVLTKPKQCICKISVKNERIMNISINFILDNNLYFIKKLYICFNIYWIEI